MPSNSAAKFYPCEFPKCSFKPRYRLRNLSSRKISRNVRAAKIYKSQNLQKSRGEILAPAIR